MSSIAVEARAIIIDHGQIVTWVKATREVVSGVPALITEQTGGGADHGRSSRTAQIRVSKQDVPLLRYQDKFVEPDGTDWVITDMNRIINDRTAGTWRVMVETSERGKF